MYPASGGSFDNGCLHLTVAACLDGENISLCIAISETFSICDLKRFKTLVIDVYKSQALVFVQQGAYVCVVVVVVVVGVVVVFC